MEEIPFGSNGGDEIRKFFTYSGLKEPNEWCCIFLNWVFRKAVGKDPPWGKGRARVPSFVAWGKAQNRWIRENDPHMDGFARRDPQSGDLWVIGDDESVSIRDNYPHIGIFAEVLPTAIRTIEGNVAIGSAWTHTRVGRDASGRYVAGYVVTV